MEKRPDVTLNYRQACNLYQLLCMLDGVPTKGAGSYHSIGRIWETVGIQINALERDVYGEVKPIEGSVKAKPADSAPDG